MVDTSIELALYLGTLRMIKEHRAHRARRASRVTTLTLRTVTLTNRGGGANRKG